jgi:hypothetical protein
MVVMRSPQQPALRLAANLAMTIADTAAIRGELRQSLAADPTVFAGEDLAGVTHAHRDVLIEVLVDRLGEALHEADLDEGQIDDAVEKIGNLVFAAALRRTAR